MIVDFGTAITYDVVGAAGEYVGGIIAPGVEISMEALTSRAAAIPKIDLTPPRALIGKSTVEAIRSGVIYGFAAQVDGMLERLREELGEETAAVATGGLASAIVPFCDQIDEVDPLLTLTGLRLIHEREPKPERADARVRCTSHGSWAGSRSRTASCSRRSPGIGNWFVRLQAKRYGAGLAVSRDGLQPRDPLRQPQDARRAARRRTPTSAPAARSRSSCSARTRRSCAPPRRSPPSAAPT